MVDGLGGHRVDEVFLDLSLAHVRRGDSAGDARPCRALWKATTSASPITRAALTVTNSGSPGPIPTPHSLPGAHSTSLAIALTAAAVIALPPRRPRTTR